ncbi:GNAT family N-acetyltransferase [Streptomyces sp. NPDC096132]|uniref:GNAT family N-acetyltransferase n=1 Tax=Streptomyces sp. NPDC096132 TaxID=3366075 RepID=UPI0038094EF9
MPALRPILRVRKATDRDLSDLLLVDREAFPGDPYPYSVLRQFMDTFTDHLRVVEADGRLCGYVLATPPNQARSWIFSLGVSPDMRGQGLGRRLMTETLDALRAEGAATVLLWVEPSNKQAVALYESLGFVPSDKPLKDHFGPGEDRLLMSLTF